MSIWKINWKNLNRKKHLYADVEGLTNIKEINGKPLPEGYGILERSPTGDRSWVDSGLDVSAHPEVKKYQIRWFSGSWSMWRTAGENDLDWKRIDGSWVTNSKPSNRRVWSYFSDHTHRVLVNLDEIDECERKKIEGYEDKIGKAEKIGSEAEEVISNQEANIRDSYDKLSEIQRFGSKKCCFTMILIGGVLAYMIFKKK